MKFAAVLVAAASAVMAHPGNVTVVTEVVESYVTYCPSPTTITFGSSTITVTEPTTITITDCPCTITKPVITTSSVVCHDCPGNPGHPGTNGTIPTLPPTVPVPTGGVTVTTEPGLPPTETPGTPPPTGAAAKVGFSGLAGLAMIAALL